MKWNSILANTACFNSVTEVANVYDNQQLAKHESGYFHIYYTHIQKQYLCNHRSLKHNKIKFQISHNFYQGTFK